MVSQVTLLLITVFSVVGLILRYLPRKTIYWFPGKAEDWIYKLPYLKKIIDDLHLKEKVVSLHKWMKDLDTFYLWLVTLAALGVSWAFLSPIAFNLGLGSDDGSRLRQMILYATGGLVGTMTLVETRRRNEQDHIRQVHAERRSRYAKAIEQLADEKAPIRLGGVYTLAKLVDEWLADKKTLPSEKERRQEGQIIIDSLCAYIRSSFLLAERYDELTLSYEEYQQNRQGNQDLHSPQVIPLPKPKNAKQSREEFVRDKSLFQEEQEVRKTILLEIKNRLNGGTTKNKDGRDEIEPGTWSYFEYDFSNAVFFYDVNFNEVNFSGKKTSFLETKFTQKAEFSGSIFNEITDFSGAHFYGEDATFSEKTDFSGAHFHSIANFSWAEFTGNANFFEAEFTGNANFSWAKFTKASFSRAKFTRDANFSWAEFTGDANFSWAEFTGDANFSMAEFTKKANFSNAKFTDAHFFEAEFTGSAGFFEAEFTGSAGFSGATFEEKPIFERALGDKTYKARFSYKADPEVYNFKVSHNSRYKIETEEQEHNGIKFIIPKGTELFDPDEPSE